MRRGSFALTTLMIAVSFGVFVPTRPAHAAFPGANGKIAFVRGGDIWVANPDGSGAARLTTHAATERSPRWSPDGRKLAFASNRDGDFEIFVIHANGSNERQLTFNMAQQDRLPAWTADGDRILYDKNFTEIYAINADGSDGERKLVDGFTPATSPYGEGIVFASPENDGLVVMRLEGGGRRQITDGPADFSANWSPRGNDLAFTRTPGADRDVYVVHVSGTGLMQLTDTPDRFEFAPVWSPDGERVAFVGCPGPFAAPNCKLYVVERNGSGEFEVLDGVTGGEGAVDWQPVVALRPTAGEASPAFTRGDAEAVFNARHSGGDAILLHSPTAEGAPADSSFRIGPGSNFDGKRLCATDWHLINIFLATGGDATFSHADAVAELEPLEFHWTLDGVPMDSAETPVKAITDPASGSTGWERAFFISNGYILAPDELSVGQHTSHLVVDNSFGPGMALDFGDVVFYVDPPGSAALRLKVMRV